MKQLYPPACAVPGHPITKCRSGEGWGIFLVLFLSLTAIGCSERPADRRTTTQSTLAPHRVEVANANGPQWAPQTAWRLEEDLRLGGADASPQQQQFGQVWSVVSDSRGLIYVLDDFSQNIKVFNPDGTFSHTIGRRGSGPGEFEAARAMTLGAGDTLWVVDDGAARYSAFAPDGSFVTSYRRRINGYAPVAQWSQTGGDAYVDWGIGYPEGRLGPVALYYPIRFVPGARLDSFPPVQYRWRVLRSGLPNTFFTGGLSIAVDRGGDIWFARTTEYRIYRRTLEGDTTLAFSLPATPAPTGEEERQYIRTRFARLPSLRSEILDALPKTKPIIHGILPDNAGHVFVFADVAGEPEGTVVDVFRDTGAYLGRMILPTPVSFLPSPPLVAYVSPDHLFVVVHDTFDVPYVSRLRIVKRR